VSFSVGLLQEEVLQRALFFYNSFSEYLNAVMVPGFDYYKLPELPLPTDIPPTFAHLPEWVISDMADFLKFILQ